MTNKMTVEDWCAMLKVLDAISYFPFSIFHFSFFVE